MTAEAKAGSGYRVEVVRTLAELERLRPVWETLPWQREEAAYEYFVARIGARAGVIGPFGAVVSDGGELVAALAGRVEARRLTTALGYRVVYAPHVRALRVVDGGLVSRGERGLSALVGVVEDVLRSEHVDVVVLPPLEVGSEALRAFEAVGGPLGRQPFITSWPRRRLALPGSFDEYLASRSQKTRYGTRRDMRRFEQAYGEQLSVEVLRRPEEADRLVQDADRVARSTYQRRLGAGFADTAEQRALTRVGLEHGWIRGYLLYLDATPIAYWLCSVYDRTILLRTGGFDEAYAEHAVGIYLLMHLIEDACLDPGLDVLDFGPGDAAYKRQFSSESSEERNVVLFAPTPRARGINALRTAILGPARVAREALDAARLTDPVRSRWRGRLRNR